MTLNRAIMFPILITGFMLLSAGADARDAMVSCVNPTSGASWRIHIDYDKRTVDANAASISNNEISWRDSSGSHYTLDRKSGVLTQITPSSTGGYFLHDRCKLS